MDVHAYADFAQKYRKCSFTFYTSSLKLTRLESAYIEGRHGLGMFSLNMKLSVAQLNTKRGDGPYKNLPNIDFGLARGTRT